MSEQQPIRVLVVDDHAVVREGLGALIRLQADMEVVGEAGNGREAVEQARKQLPDVILMDLRMLGVVGKQWLRFSTFWGVS